MAADLRLADQVRAGEVPSTLRIYRWDRSAFSLGRRQPLEELPADLLKLKLPIVRRPTGGGAVLHRTDELTWALAVSASSPWFYQPLRQIPERVHRGLKDRLIEKGLLPASALALAGSGFPGPFSLCFSALVCGDLSYNNRKVAGAAVRGWKEGALIQGSIQGLPVPFDLLAESLKQAVLKREDAQEAFAPIHGCRG